MKAPEILIVESSPLFNSALTNVLTRMGARVSTPERVAKHRKKYDAVLVAVATFPGSADKLSELIRSYLEYGPILLLAREDHIDQIITGLRSGAVGFLTQTASRHDLRKAIDAVSNGYSWCDSQLFRQVAQYLLPVEQWPRPKLTRREEEVLHCLGLRQTNKEIAQSLEISVQSVKVYVSNLLRKTGVANRGDLAMRAISAFQRVEFPPIKARPDFPAAKTHF